MIFNSIFKRIVISATAFLWLLCLATPVYSQEFEQQSEEALTGQVVEVLENEYRTVEGIDEKQLYQLLKIRILKGSIKGSVVEIENGNYAQGRVYEYNKGDRLIISYYENQEGKPVFLITNIVRTPSLLWLTVIAVILIIWIGRIKGLTSLVGMIFSFAVIMLFIIPGILAGKNPVVTSIIGSVAIVPVTFYLSHGFTRKTSVAVISTLISLACTIIFATFFVNAAKLTGLGSDDAMFLLTIKDAAIDLKGLVLAGIIIGTLGILDDITIAQVGIVFRLKELSPGLRADELYFKAIEHGRDHIASMVNTLVLAYTGASLPILLLFADSSRGFDEVINMEMIAEEVVRTLVGSIGLVLAIPISTFAAVFACQVSKSDGVVTPEKLSVP
ncbi:YibE/F family protein [Candidatus Dojkabacteria bacterium]|nr:YibE/F family protein [Candidatus Dojkabacteria bacterium]